MKPNEGTKPTLVSSATTGAKGKDADADEALVPPPPPKVGLLPTGLSRAMVIGSVLVVITGGAVGLLGNRYSIISAVRSENAIVYRIDKLTGSVSFCSPAVCTTIPDVSVSEK